MIKSILLPLIVLTFFFSEANAAGLGGGNTSNRSIPNSGAPNPLAGPLSPYGKVLRGLEELNRQSPGSVNCNQTLDTSARALICSCANEAGVERQPGKVAVQRVVFSRTKSTEFPNSVKGVICQSWQFSWLSWGNRAYSQNCVRNPARRANHLNSPTVREPVLSQCYAATAEAARLEYDVNPTTLYATHYASTNPAAYRAYGSSMPQWVRNLIAQGAPRVGAHVFGFSTVGYRQSTPPNGTSSVIVRLFNSILDSLFNSAFAKENETNIINTKSKQKVYFDPRVKKILADNHPNFKMHPFKKYSKFVKELMSGVRKNLPMALEGDFDGVGSKDLILMGTDGKKNVAISILFGAKNKVTSKVINTFSDAEMGKPLDMYVVHIPKKKIKHSSGVSRDAFQIEKFGGVAIPYFLSGDKFIQNNSKNGFLWIGQNISTK